MPPIAPAALIHWSFIALQWPHQLRMNASNNPKRSEELDHPHFVAVQHKTLEVLGRQNRHRTVFIVEGERRTSACENTAEEATKSEERKAQGKISFGVHEERISTQGISVIEVSRNEREFHSDSAMRNKHGTLYYSHSRVGGSTKWVGMRDPCPFGTRYVSQARLHVTPPNRTDRIAISLLMLRCMPK